MEKQRPTPEQIQQWIEGALNAEDSRVIEPYYEQHPEELPDPEVPPLLKEASQTTSPEVSELVTKLQLQFASQKHKLPNLTNWVDLLTPTETPGLLGHLGHFEVLEVLATTGMAVVLKARDPQLKRLLAIKILAPALATQPKAHERFLREAQAMASLQHEAILPVYHVQADEIPWFAMRYVAGGTLQDALDAHEPFLSTPEFLERLATKVAQALALAHREGLIHRDIKPANILLSRDRSQIWLTDFGIARATDDPALTSGQALAGTPRYMSPEQANCAPLDNRSDLFSLGAVLYHCATGRPPFRGESSTQVLYQIVSAEPSPLSKSLPHLSRWLSQLIHDCLRKNPSERPDLLVALRERKVRREPILKWAALLTILLLGIALLALWNNRKENEQNETSKTKPTQIIRVEETDKTFTSLPHAIFESPPGSTLELSGNFLIQERIATSLSMSLHLKAAEGTKPRILIRDTHVGFEIGGNLTVEGIHFEHYGPQGEKIILLARDAESLTVSDCSFFSDAKTASDTKPHWGIIAQSVGRTVVQRSTFQGQTMGAIVLYDGKHTIPYRNGHLTLSDSLLNCPNAVQLRSRSAETEFDITIERIIFRGNDFIADSKHNATRPTRVTVRDSLIDASLGQFVSFHGDAAQALKNLTWTSERSHYAHPNRALVVTGKNATIQPLPEITGSPILLFGTKRLLYQNYPLEIQSAAQSAFEQAPAPNPNFHYQRPIF